VRCADDNEPVDDFRLHRGKRPGDEPSPPVPDHDRAALAERGDQAGSVRRQRRQVVTARRLVGRAVPAEVGRRGPEPGLGQADQLVAPEPPELRKAVQQQDERTGTGLGYVETAAVGADVTVMPRAVDEDGGDVRGGFAARRSRILRDGRCRGRDADAGPRRGPP
jgi:hypothetical protein